MDAAKLPELSKEAHQRIERALIGAQARLKDAFLERALKAKLKPTLIKKTVKHGQTLLKLKFPSMNDHAAAIHYLDAMAWEYMSSRSAAEFAALSGEIAEAAIRMFDCGVRGHRTSHPRLAHAGSSGAERAGYHWPRDSGKN